MSFTFNTISEADILRSPGGRAMMDAINYRGDKNLVVTGCPGSGKTTVSIMRSLKLREENKNVLLITYQNLLRTSLENLAGAEMSRRIGGFYEWFCRTADARIESGDTHAVLINKIEHIHAFDEILIDEGQDLEERFLRTLIAKAKKISVGSDTAQRVHAHGLDSSEIVEIVEESGSVSRINLLYNYRNNFETYNFARFFLPHNERANNNLTLERVPKGNGTSPVIFQALDEEEKKSIIRTRLNEAGDVNIAILVYHIDEVESYHSLVTSLGFECSKYYQEMDKGTKKETERNLKNIVVTTFKAAKGLEFQVVIMPNLETALDRDYKTPEHYYVGCTRAKERLFLIFNGAKPDLLDGFPSESYEFVAGSGGRASIEPEEDDDFPF